MQYQYNIIGIFATWAPHLYSYYVDHLGPLFKCYPDLWWNFVNSVFACTTFNFGPHICCFGHINFRNLPFGWCAITALGNFNPIFGGHLVLWDLKIVIDFPPGLTILMPSSTIRHSNNAIHQGETQYPKQQILWAQNTYMGRSYGGVGWLAVYECLQWAIQYSSTRRFFARWSKFKKCLQSWT